MPGLPPNCTVPVTVDPSRMASGGYSSHSDLEGAVTGSASARPPVPATAAT